MAVNLHRLIAAKFLGLTFHPPFLAALSLATMKELKKMRWPEK